MSITFGSSTAGATSANLINTNGAIKPYVTATDDIGSSTLTYKDVYMTGNLYGNKLSEVAIAAATTLTVAQSGALFKVTPGSGFAITIPTAASSAGVKYRIQLVAAASGGAVTVAPASGSTLKGVCTTPTGGITSGGTATLTFSTSAVAGDFVELASDGVNWGLHAVSRINIGVALT